MPQVAVFAGTATILAVEGLQMHRNNSYVTPKKMCPLFGAHPIHRRKLHPTIRQAGPIFSSSLPAICTNCFIANPEDPVQVV